MHASITKKYQLPQAHEIRKNKQLTVAVIFGSDQGLVGRFNDILTTFTEDTLRNVGDQKEIWAVGERIYSRLEDGYILPLKLFSVPNAVTAITPLVNNILAKIEEYREQDQLYNLYIFQQ